MLGAGLAPRLHLEREGRGRAAGGAAAAGRSCGPPRRRSGTSAEAGRGLRPNPPSGCGRWVGRGGGQRSPPPARPCRRGGAAGRRPRPPRARAEGAERAVRGREPPFLAPGSCGRSPTPSSGCRAASLPGSCGPCSARPGPRCRCWRWEGGRSPSCLRREPQAGRRSPRPGRARRCLASVVFPACLQGSAFRWWRRAVLEAAGLVLIKGLRLFIP